MEDCKGSLLYRTGDMSHSERAKEILSYIHKHFNEKITAAEISNQVGISRGECFRCFKHFMNKSLVEYINEYRLQRTAKLLRETEKSIIDISNDCGFENASYYAKLFKDVYSMTPLQYRKAQIWTNNSIRNINGYDYEYWRDSGNGTMIITASANNGSFSCEWNNVKDVLFRSGKKFDRFDKTHRQIGNISLRYDAYCNSKGGNVYLSVYGWTVDPLIEWYIVECYTEYKPAVNIDYLGNVNIHGDTYELYSAKRENWPSIFRIKGFRSILEYTHNQPFKRHC